MRLFRKPEHADATGRCDPVLPRRNSTTSSLSPRRLGPGPIQIASERLGITPRPTISSTGKTSAQRFIPGGPGEPDADGCWTGSVLFGEGMFHAFYTGYSIRAHIPANDLSRRQRRRRPLDQGRQQSVSSTEDGSLREPRLARPLRVLQRPGQMLLDDPLCAQEHGSNRQARLRRSLSLARLWRSGNTTGRSTIRNTPTAPSAPSSIVSETPGICRIRGFRSSAARSIACPTTPFGEWRTPRRDRIGSRRFYAAKSMADDKGRPLLLRLDARQSRQQRQGRMVLGRSFCRPARGRAVADEAVSFSLKLPQAIAGRRSSGRSIGSTSRSKDSRPRRATRCA